MPTALLVAFDAAASSWLSDAGDLRDVVLERVPSAEAALARVSREKKDIEAVVIGPMADNPLALAQRVYQMDRDVGVLILAPGERLDALRASLALTPFVGRQTRYHPLNADEGVRRELERSIDETRARRSHRSTLKALSSRLSASPALRPQAASVLDRLLELAPMGILALDAQARVLVANQAAQQMLEAPRGLERAELADCFQPESRQALEALVQDASRTGLPARTQLERERPMGPRFLEATLAPMAAREGEQGFLLILQDITERVRGERERDELFAKLEAAVRMRDEFLSIASHELRTPLTAMLGWLELLRGGKLTPEKQGRAVEIVIRNARAQAQLVDDLLDVSRIIAGKARLELGPTRLQEVIRQAVDSVTPAADAKGLSLQCLLDTHVGPVLGDAQRLQQVIWNLLSNAVKFTPRGGRVIVSLRATGSSAQITVQDTGEGIAPAFLPFVFERFRQADSSATRSHGGLGLGLSIVRHFVELHGGTVEARSEGTGKGATFIVRLPISALDAQDAPRGADDTAQEDLDRPARLAGLRVLLVEDEADVREFIVSLLESSAMKVTAVGSAKEGLEALRRAPPDVLISDIGMPEEDGYAFLRKVRALPAEEGGRVPALAITANAKPAERRRALLAGYQMHLAKPIPPEELLLVLATLTGRI